MRPLLLLCLLPVLAGCGEREREPALPAVRLTVSEPADAAELDASSVEVRGAVTPADARVRVNGADTEVVGGTFSADVALDAGANIIDIQAGAPRRPAAMAAVRVVRLVPVEVPDVIDLPVDDAVAELEGLGLEVDLEDAGGPFEGLFPGDEGVCYTDPEAGDEARAGTTVRVGTAKAC